MILDQLAHTASIGCLVFLATLTFLKKSNTPLGYRFLSLLFILIALIFSDNLLEYFGVYKVYPALVIAFEPILYLVAPFIYLGVSHLTNARKRLSYKMLLHFIPYVLLIALYVIAWLAKDTQSEPESDDDKLVEVFLLTVFFIQITVYLYFSIRQIKKHRLSLPLFVSSISDSDYSWLLKAIIGLSILSLISFTEVVFEQWHITFYFSFIYLVVFYYIGIQVAKQKEVFPFTKVQQESVSDLINDQQSSVQEVVQSSEFAEVIDHSYQSERKKVINEDKLFYYKEQIEALMEQERPYLDSEITLPALAEQLNLNTYQTSYLINTSFGENFYSFINRYRLEKCKSMLPDPAFKHLSILGIAFECGFNSKTAFNTAFKKHTGLSPKEFKEQRANSEITR